MGVPKAVAQKIIAYTAHTESGGKFDSWNPDDTGAGISFGLIQFNQAGGRYASHPGSPLAAVFKRMRVNAPQLFDATFGPYAANMMDEQWVKHANLNEPDFKARLKAAAQLTPFQEAQLEQARLDYFVPAEETAARYGIKSERGHAMLFDTAVQWGPVRMKRFAAESFGAPVAGLGAAPLTETDKLHAFAVKADAGQYTRRANILADHNLSDASIIAAGVGVGVVVTALAVWVGYRWIKG